MTSQDFLSSVFKPRISHSEGIHQQIFGTAMGSFVSVTVADMVKENIEQCALASFSHTQREEICG